MTKEKFDLIEELGKLDKLPDLSTSELFERRHGMEIDTAAIREKLANSIMEKIVNNKPLWTAIVYTAFSEQHPSYFDQEQGLAQLMEDVQQNKRFHPFVVKVSLAEKAEGGGLLVLFPYRDREIRLGFLPKKEFGIPLWGEGKAFVENPTKTSYTVADQLDYSVEIGGGILHHLGHYPEDFENFIINITKLIGKANINAAFLKEKVKEHNRKLKEEHFPERERINKIIGQLQKTSSGSDEAE